MKKHEENYYIYYNYYNPLNIFRQHKRGRWVHREKHMTTEDKGIAFSYQTEDISDLKRTVCVRMYRQITRYTMRNTLIVIPI